jgi:hypothetical protein
MVSLHTSPFAYKKKPVVIEAVQNSILKSDLTGTIPAWLIEAAVSGVLFERGDEQFIKTLEGDMKVSTGDWIIRGINGELYPCKPDIFEKTYERVPQDGEAVFT